MISLAKVGNQSDEEQCCGRASVGRRPVLEVFLELEQIVVGHDESECDAELVVLVPIQNHSTRLIGGRQLLHHILDDMDDGGVAGRLPLRGCASPSLGAGGVDRRRRDHPKPIDRGRAILDGHLGVGLEERRDELAHQLAFKLLPGGDLGGIALLGYGQLQPDERAEQNLWSAQQDADE